MPSSNGGAAGAGGHEFQAQVAAFYAAGMLCAPAFTVGLGLPSGTMIERVRCETEAEVDDTELALAPSGRVLVQAKRSVTASRNTRSPLAKTLGQFVGAYLDAERDNTPLSVADSRLLLATTSSASQAIREDLPSVLARAVGDPSAALGSVSLTNDRQRSVWPIVLGHLRTAWQARKAQPPSDDQLRPLLNLIRIQQLDFGPEGRDEGQAKASLIDQVLADPGQADLVWARLTALMLSNAAGQRAIGPGGLAQLLTNEQVGLRALPSVRDDIARLATETDRTTRALEPLSEIRLADTTVKLQRSSAAATVTRAMEGSCLLVGQPGGGKSGVLYDAIVAAREQGLDVVALAADRFSAATVHDIEMALELDRPIVDVLAGWPGPRPGIVFVDALDAARGGEGPDAFVQLLSDIRQLDSRWVVIASIRTFDLRYRPDLQRSFRGTPDGDLVDPEFVAVRHLQVPLLDDGELAQLRHAAPSLAAFLAEAPVALVDLVRNPFNLARLAELLDLGVEADELNQVATQLQLLDVYWRERVLVPSEGMLGRERILRELCDRAIRSLRLSVSRAELAAIDGADQPVNELLRSGVLIEASGPGGAQTFALSHHLLFDYAAERLLLRLDTAELVERLREQPDLALIARPSLTLHFQWLWQNARHAYWDLTLQIAAEPSLRLLARLVGPAVAAEAASSLEDLDPLITAFEMGGETRTRAREVLRHLIGARIAAGVDSHPLQGAPTRVWSRFAARLTALLGDTVDAVRILAWGLGQERDRLSGEDMDALGATARGLLRYALGEEFADDRPLRQGVETVALTFATSPAESESLLRRLIEPTRLAERGYAELFTLAQAAEDLHSVVPAFVADLYEAAFSTREESTDPVQLTGGVLATTSTRRQDYDMGLYVLAEGFPEFLRAAPREAVRGLIAARRSYAKEHGPTGDSRRVGAFDFRGNTARVADDYSLTWDSGSFGRDDAGKLLNDFEERLEQLADVTDTGTIEMMLDVVGAAEVPAAIWRRILRVAARRPAVMATILLEALTSHVLLEKPDTQELAALAVVAAYTHLAAGDQEKINRTVNGLPDAFEEQADGEELRDMLQAALRGDVEVPAARHPELVTDPWPSGDWQRDPPAVGNPSQDQRRFDELLLPVKALSLAPAPPIETIDWPAAMAGTRALEEALPRLDVPDHDRDEAAGFIAAACLRAVGREPLPHDAASRFALETLTWLARHPKPEVETSLDGFDEGRGWNVPAPRIDAAKGLLALGRAPGLLDEAALATIKQLADDPAAAVRYAFASKLRWLRDTDLDLTWELAERIARLEPSRMVQAELLRTVAVLATIDQDRALDLALEMHARELARTEPRDVLLTLIGGFLIELSVWTGADHGDTILDRLTQDLAGRHKETERVLFRLREAATTGEIGHLDDRVEVRARAISVFERLLVAGVNAFDQIVQASRTDRGVDLGDRVDEFRRISEVIDHTAAEVFFASGAYIDVSNDPRPRLDEAKRRRFYYEADGLLDALVRIAWPPSAVHHVLEILQEAIAFAPREVLLRIGQLVRSSRDWGYQNDSLAQGTFVEIVQTYLTAHRTLVSDEEARIALLDSLDAFVDAGWPAARRLVYRLDEAFR